MSEQKQIADTLTFVIEEALGGVNMEYTAEAGGMVGADIEAEVQPTIVNAQLIPPTNRSPDAALQVEVRGEDNRLHTFVVAVYSTADDDCFTEQPGSDVGA